MRLGFQYKYGLCIGLTLTKGLSLEFGWGLRLSLGFDLDWVLELGLWLCYDYVEG